MSEENHADLIKDTALGDMLLHPSKLSAFLFAILQGATVILDTPCHPAVVPHDLNKLVKSFSYKQDAMNYNETFLFNPFAHFGYQSVTSNVLKTFHTSDVFRSGLDMNSSRVNSDMYTLQILSDNFIQQTVSTCYGQCNHSKQLLHPYNPSHLPVTVARKTIPIFDSGPTIFHKDAFVSMFVPPDLSPHKQNIFRSLLIFGIQLFYPIPVTYNLINHQIPNYHDCSLRNEIQNETVKLDDVQVKDFVRWLNSSSCSKHSDIEITHCMLDLLTKINNIIGSTASQISVKRRRIWHTFFMAWADDLIAVGLDDKSLKSKRSLVIKNRAKYLSYGVKIRYTFQWSTLMKFSNKQKHQLQIGVYDKISERCSNATNSLPSTSFTKWKYPMIRDILLIVTINYKHLFSTINYLEFMHRSFFKYIAYCGPDVNEFEKYANENGFHYVTFITGLTGGWKLMYECTFHAMKLNLAVKGYLQIGDDTLLNIPLISNLPRDEIWIPGGFDKKNFLEVESLDYWGHWQQEYGRLAIINIYHELFNVTKSDSSSIIVNGQKIIVSGKYRDFVRRFIWTYDKNIGTGNAIHRAVDIFYVPQVVRSDFMFAADLFLRHGSMVEMAIPMILHGIQSLEKVRHIAGASLWRENRQDPWNHFNSTSMYFLHPFKSIAHLNTNDGKEFFCNTFLPHLFNYTTKSKRSNG